MPGGLPSQQTQTARSKRRYGPGDHSSTAWGRRLGKQEGRQKGRQGCGLCTCGARQARLTAGCPSRDSELPVQVSTATRRSSKFSSKQRVPREARAAARRTVFAGGVNDIISSLHCSSRNQHIIQVRSATRRHQLQAPAGHNVQRAVKRRLRGRSCAARLQQCTAVAARSTDGRQAPPGGVQACQAAAGDVSSVHHSAAALLWRWGRLLRRLWFRWGLVAAATAAIVAAAATVAATATAAASACCRSSCSAAAALWVGAVCGRRRRGAPAAITASWLLLRIAAAAASIVAAAAAVGLWGRRGRGRQRGGAHVACSSKGQAGRQA